jgi:hypothetical protein
MLPPPSASAEHRQAGAHRAKAEGHVIGNPGSGLIDQDWSQQIGDFAAAAGEQLEHQRAKHRHEMAGLRVTLGQPTLSGQLCYYCTACPTCRASA